MNIVFTAIYERTTRRYGDRGIRYVHMKAGHAAQNVYLQAIALGLGTVVVGAFRDDQVSEILNLPKNERPLYIMPEGGQSRFDHFLIILRISYMFYNILIKLVVHQYILFQLSVYTLQKMGSAIEVSDADAAANLLIPALMT